ncbi:MAG TPA: hypothetical protein VJK02_23120 [Anaerolineales bacterium]|nr:hypothetical protein [Anaerolineales bacterium]
MKNTVVFRPRIAIRVFWAVFPVLIVGGSLAMMTWLFGGWAWLGEMEGDWIGFLGLLPLAMVIFLLGMVGYMAAVWWSERIIFADTYVERRGIPHAMLRKGRLAYDDIRQVRRAMRNVLLLEPKEGKPWIIAVKQYGAGFPRILEELRRHVAAECVEPGLEETLTARDRRDRRLSWLNGAAGAFIVGASLLMWNNALGGAFSTWRLAAGISRSLRVEGYEIGDDNSVWVLTREAFVDFEDLSDLTVRRLAPQADAPLQLPPASEVFPGETDVSPYFAELHLDRAGRPWIEFWYEDLLLLWSGEEWEPYQPPEGVLEPGMEFAALADGVLWYGLSGESRLISLDPANGVAVEHLLGEEESGGYPHILSRPDSLLVVDYRVVPDGALTLAVDYYTSGLWSGWIPIEMPPSEDDLGWPEDYALDQEGNLYLLLKPGEPCYRGALHGWLGRWDAARQVWEWRELTTEERCRSWSDFGGLVVDPLGRVWVQAGRSVAVYPGAASGAPAHGVRPIIVYTEDNSGYERGPMRLDAQGRIWAGGDYSALAWIDASGDELAKPLPGWLAFFLGTPWGGNVLMYVGLILFLVSIAVARKSFRRNVG